MTHHSMRHGRGHHAPAEMSSPAVTLSPTYDRYWTGTSTDGSWIPVPVSNQVSVSTSEILRSDGFRKKNAKFDIPDGRTLDTLDGLIATARDSEDIKELKAQKRLLKNREAALQSRQRKKQHTEGLEGEKKQFMHLISQYENKLAAVSSEIEQLIQEKLELQWKVDHATEQTQQLAVENSRLLSQLHALQETLQTAPCAPGSHTGLPLSFAAFDDGLNLDPLRISDWPDLIENVVLSAPGSSESLLERTETFLSADQSHAIQDHNCGPVDEASRLMLFLIAAGASLTASPAPQTVGAILRSPQIQFAKSGATSIMHFILTGGEVRPNESCNPTQSVNGAWTESLDSQSSRLLSALLQNMDTELIREIRIMLQSAQMHIKYDAAPSSVLFSGNNPVSGRRRR